MNKIDELKQLVDEARELMIAVGESSDVPIQFRQHAWLRKANEAVPLPQDPPVTKHQAYIKDIKLRRIKNKGY